MYRSHTNGELRIENVDQHVTLCGWVQKSRDLGAMTFVDLRDRYGITQLVLGEEHAEVAKNLGREDIMVIAGGVIPQQDYDFLYDSGVAGVYGPGTKISLAAQEMLNILIEAYK